MIPLRLPAPRQRSHKASFTLDLSSREPLAAPRFSGKLAMIDVALWGVGMNVDVEHMEPQRVLAVSYFDPEDHCHAVIARIVREIENAKDECWSTNEWINFAFLALYGAWRTGAEQAAVVAEFRDALGPWPSGLIRPTGVGENDLLPTLMHLRYASNMRNNRGWKERTQHLHATMRNRFAAAPYPTLRDWIDVLILALGGACLSSPFLCYVVNDIKAKRTRYWPDWREGPTDRAIESAR